MNLDGWEWNFWAMRSFCISLFEELPTYSVPAVPFYVLASNVQGFRFPHILIDTFFVGVKWYLVVILICFSLVANGTEYLIMCFWGHFYTPDPSF